MAQITFSPLIVAASGKVKDTVFSIWKGRPYIRARVTPSNPQSTAQTLQRDIMTAAVAMWQGMHAALVTAWNAYATAYRMSGYNSCSKRNASTDAPNGDGSAARMQAACNYFPALMQPTAGAASLDTLTVVTGVGASGTIDLAWAAGTWTSSDKVYIGAYNAQDPVLVGTPGTTMQEIDADTAVAIITGLTAGEDYNVGVIVYDASEETWGSNQGDNTVTAKA